MSDFIRVEILKRSGSGLAMPFFIMMLIITKVKGPVFTIIMKASFAAYNFVKEIAESKTKTEKIKKFDLLLFPSKVTVRYGSATVR